MKSIIVAAGLLGLAATAAYAQTAAPQAPPPRPERAKADANGDGQVTLAEFQAAAARRFDRMDANKDGRITKDELAMARPPAPRPGADGKRPGGDGPDGRGRHGGMGRHMGAMRDAAFARMDANDDGVVTRQEAESAAQRLFAFLDLNQDGVLSGKELPPRRMGRGLHGHPGTGGPGMDGPGPA